MREKAIEIVARAHCVPPHAVEQNMDRRQDWKGAVDGVEAILWAQEQMAKEGILDAMEDLGYIESKDRALVTDERISGNDHRSG